MIPELCLALACISGFTAVAAVFAWPFFDRRQTVLAIQCFGASAFAVHFVSIGASTAAVSSGVAVTQLLAAALLDKRRILLAVYAVTIAALLTLAVLSWHGAPSLLAVFGSFIATAARLQRSTTMMKACFVISTPFWVAHNILVGSTFGLAVDTVSIGCNAAALVRWSIRHPDRLSGSMMAARRAISRRPAGVGRTLACIAPAI